MEEILSTLKQGPMTAEQIAEKLNMSKKKTSTAIHQLRQQGLIVNMANSNQVRLARGRNLCICQIL